MSERMTDKRLAEFIRNFKSEMPIMYVAEIGELLVALKAERNRIAELEAQIEAVKKVRDTLMEYSLPEDDPEDPDLELAENVVKDLNQALKDSGVGDE